MDRSRYERKAPAEEIVPHQVLLLSKHRHDDECVQINPLAQHPEVVTAKQVEVDELGNFAARWIPLHQLLVVCDRSQPNDGDDRIQNKGKEEVFVEGDPLAAQTLEMEEYSKGDEKGSQ